MVVSYPASELNNISSSSSNSSSDKLGLVNRYGIFENQLCLLLIRALDVCSLFPLFDFLNMFSISSLLGI